MSIKINFGYRVRIVELPAFLDLTRIQVYDLAEKITKFVCDSAIEEEIEAQRKEHPFIEDEKKLRFKHAMHFFTQLSKSKYRTYPHLDINFGYNIWMRHNHFYIVPVGEHNISSNIKYPDFVQEYGY